MSQHKAVVGAAVVEAVVVRVVERGGREVGRGEVARATRKEGREHHVGGPVDGICAAVGIGIGRVIVKGIRRDIGTAAVGAEELRRRHGEGVAGRGEREAVVVVAGDGIDASEGADRLEGVELSREGGAEYGLGGVGRTGGDAKK